MKSPKEQLISDLVFVANYHKSEARNYNMLANLISDWDVSENKAAEIRDQIHLDSRVAKARMFD